MNEDFAKSFSDLQARAADIRGYLDETKLKPELDSLESKMSDASFWSNPLEAQKVQKRRKRLDDDINFLARLRREEDDVKVLVDWFEAGEDVTADLAAGLQTLQASIEAAEFQKMLGGEVDRASAILTINAGAGGTDSQDWAEMLLRMYLRWCDRRGFKCDITEIQAGEEAGIKSVTLMVEGEYAFGYLFVEAGVHRLVRISPFDGNARRQTAFAAVFTWPQVEDDIKIDIQDKDLRVDTYRSSGAGGQHVNVTDSAVRITHLPTGIAVACQNERSQIRNREVAMKVLKSRLYDLELQKQRAKLDAVESAKKDIAFGSQIRSYVLHPYKMIKDHRTRYEVGNVDAVLDGDLDGFIKAALVAKARGQLGPAVAED
ncbi:MAG: peptide chain release factor 2 [Vicinamibacteria bacterium]|nr:peptide chain release factor 2 [Vicinamibacteria bacterium]